MKFGLLTEYNLRNIFAEKSYKKCAAETIPRLLSKILKLIISLDQLDQSFFIFRKIFKENTSPGIFY